MLFSSREPVNMPLPAPVLSPTAIHPALSDSATSPAPGSGSAGTSHPNAQNHSSDSPHPPSYPHPLLLPLPRTRPSFASLDQCASDGVITQARFSDDADRPKSSYATLGRASTLDCAISDADTAAGTPNLRHEGLDSVTPRQTPKPAFASPFISLDTPVQTDYNPVRTALSPASASASTFAHSQPPPHVPGHKKNALSIESVPRQTIMKALASVARNNRPEPLSLSGMLSAHNMPQDGDNRPSTSSSQKLCDALNGIALSGSTSLQSPCFYHNRFDDAVDIDKVLEEIKNDEWMSHSRLVQTATGVREVSKQLQRRPIRRAVKNVMIVTKARDNQLVVLTRELALWLLRTPRYGSDLGVNVYVDAKLRNSKRFNASSITDENPRFQTMLKYWSPDLCWSQPEKFDLVLTLGGDGTVLFTSWLFQRIVPPVLSFSLGSLGFLTNFEFERYKDHLNRIMGDEGMRVNLRMRFTCTVYRDGPLGQEMEEGEQFEVLNELVIDRGPSPYVSNLELYGDNELLTVVQADGCIFSTPTGSTAYSLSAGGSLVHPDIPAILLTPICPHTLSFRPMVLSDTMLLRVTIPRNSRATAYCAFDGKGRVELRQGDSVTITASQYPFPTVVRTDAEWFDSVSRTLRWNTRGAMQKAFDASSGGTGSDAGGEQEEEGWDIDTDSACYASEEGSVSASPLRRQMSLLGM
ncbi:ATP-NAD kinase [Neurospora crassa]|uniref:NAD+ kinase Utr1 n=1 Tax=Neurospora crassa (strain ATCC 24698 / 74-OR23-1A / CBS 708.71 / DSM 1257 / FGSC 987) TaxID=367110 RepID=Q7SEG1_NEUCR|nr:NAD+ kinase Utr1 [Neurospora crassa OR74A]EAA35184.2 NAD+ kinase Utr1 [Neurospora crassa OR74A]KHE79868.1 ATP-NAD kinase [Neurospora crassa]|eukprot:XP_964420.2 NAD+ kinase Utr1 [Neurospora crassa OR74A]